MPSRPVGVVRSRCGRPRPSRAAANLRWLATHAQDRAHARPDEDGRIERVDRRAAVVIMKNASACVPECRLIARLPTFAHCPSMRRERRSNWTLGSPGQTARSARSVRVMSSRRGMATIVTASLLLSLAGMARRPTYKTRQRSGTLRLAPHSRWSSRMDFPQLVTLYFERSVALQNYWTLYVVIIGGLLAFSSMRARPNRLTTVLITVLFLCFAYKNCGAILDVSKQRIAVLGDVRTASMHQEALYADGRAQSFVGRSVLPSMEDVPTPGKQPPVSLQLRRPHRAYTLEHGMASTEARA